jgi:hypothetical protein
MLADHLGDTICWLGCIVAAVILAIGTADYWFGNGGLFSSLGWVTLAAIPWAIGGVTRYSLTGRW